MAKTNAINALMHVTKQRHTAVKPLAKQEVTSVLPYQKTVRPVIVVRVRRIALLITAKQSAHQAARVSQQPQPPQRLAAKLVTNAHILVPADGVPEHVRTDIHAAPSVLRYNAIKRQAVQVSTHTQAKVHVKAEDITVQKVSVVQAVGKEHHPQAVQVATPQIIRA